MGFCDGGDGAGELPLEIAEIAGVCGLVQSKRKNGKEEESLPVILRNLSLVVVSYPEIEFLRYSGASDWKFVLDDCGKGNYISNPQEPGEGIVDRVAEESKRIRVQGDVGEETEEVFGVEFATCVVAGCINTAEDIVREESGVYGKGLGDVVWVHVVLEEAVCEVVEFIESVVRSLMGV